MINMKRFAVRESAIVTFYALQDLTDLIKAGDPIVTLDTLKTSGVETSGETVYARGGRGNAKLVGFSGNREARLTLEDALFDLEAVKLITGNYNVPTKKTVEINDDFEVQDSKVTLVAKPNAGTTIRVFAVNNNDIKTKRFEQGETLGTGVFTYDESKKEMTFFTSDLQNGDKVQVSYESKTKTEVPTIKVTADKFGGTFKVVMDCLVRDQETSKDYQAQIIIPKAKFEDNFNFNFSADGDPATFTLPLEVLKDTKTPDMWEMVIYDADDLEI